MLSGTYEIQPDEYDKSEAPYLPAFPPQTLDWSKSNKFKSSPKAKSNQKTVNSFKDDEIIGNIRIEIPKSRNIYKENSNILFPQKLSQTPNSDLSFKRKKKKKKTNSLIAKLRRATLNPAMNFLRGKTIVKSKLEDDNPLLKNRTILKWFKIYKKKRRNADFTNLSAKQLFMIGDPCSMVSENTFDSDFQELILRKKGIGQFLLRKVIQIVSLTYKQIEESSHLANLFFRLPVINPEGIFKLYWNIFICLCISYQFFTITIELFFDSNWYKINPKLTESITLLSDALKYLFLFDLLLNFITGFYQKGVIIYENREIFKNYVRKYLIIDLLAILPLFIDLDSMDNSDTAVHDSGFNISSFAPIKLLFVFRLMKLTRTYYYIEQILANNKKIEGLLSLLKLCISIIGTAHSLACVWYYIATKNMKNNSPSWLTSIKLCSQGTSLGENTCDWRTNYLYSLYWAITTMITVGYGDITPANEYEIAFCLLSMIFGCGVFGYSLNNIGVIFEKLQAGEKEFKTKVRMINRYMKRKNVDFELQGRVRRYLEYILKESSNENAEEEQELIQKLSNTLRKELLMQTNGKVLMNNPIFRNNFSQATIEKLSEFIDQQDFANEELLFEENSTDNEKIYFISKGRVDLFAGCDNGNSNYLRLRSLGEGDAIGEIAFFTGQRHAFNAVSIGFTKVFFVNKTNFLDVMREEPEDYERFCSMRDNLITYMNSQDFCHPCFCCEEKDHQVQNCPILRYQPEKLLLIKKYLEQKKLEKKRPRELNRKRTKNSLLTLKRLFIAQRLLFDKMNINNNDDDPENNDYKRENEAFPGIQLGRKSSVSQDMNVHEIGLQIITNELERDDPESPTKKLARVYSLAKMTSEWKKAKMKTIESPALPKQVKISSNDSNDKTEETKTAIKLSTRSSFTLEPTPRRLEKKPSNLYEAEKKSVNLYEAEKKSGNFHEAEKKSGNLYEAEKTFMPMQTKLEPSNPPLTKKPHRILHNNDQSIKVENDIDRIRDFKLYFPYNNSLKVIRVINKKLAHQIFSEFCDSPNNDDKNSIKELLEVNRNYSQGLFLKHRRLDKAKFTFKK